MSVHAILPSLVVLLLILSIVPVNNEEIPCENNKMASREVDLEVYLESLKENVGKIKLKCGEVCETKTVRNVSKGAWYDVLEKKVDCKALFQLIEELVPLQKLPMPLRKIPKFLLDDFTYQGRVTVKQDYMNDNDGATHKLHWNREDVDCRVNEFKNGESKGSYSKADRLNIERHLRDQMDVEGKHALVIGSQSPWLESLLLSLGEVHVTTLEYLPILSDHPQLTVLTPNEMSRLFLLGQLSSFDLGVTFSSLEHSGLGRYGDDLDPWADLIEMSRMWCVMKPGAKVLVGVPTGPKDMITFNAARVYGKLQYSHLFANWRQVYTEANLDLADPGCDWCYQPLHIVEKP